MIANEFNKYFQSIASKLNENYSEDHITLDAIPSFSNFLPKTCESSIYLSDCTQ